jgi:hypothetical protein
MTQRAGCGMIIEAVSIGETTEGELVGRQCWWLRLSGIPLLFNMVRRARTPRMPLNNALSSAESATSTIRLALGWWYCSPTGFMDAMRD